MLSTPIIAVCSALALLTGAGAFLYTYLTRGRHDPERDTFIRQALESINNEIIELKKEQEDIRVNFAGIRTEMGELNEATYRNLRKMSSRAQRAEEKERFIEELQELDNHSQPDQGQLLPGRFRLKKRGK